MTKSNCISLKFIYFGGALYSVGIRIYQ